MKKKNISGGGSNTNKNGIPFERKVSLEKELIKSGYEIKELEIYKNNKLFGYYLSKGKLYKFLKEKGINYKDYISKKQIPDSCCINLSNNTIYILEKKYQNRSGSVDEKLQTCDYKKKQYEKLLNSLGFKVEYIYVLSNWFKRMEYRDNLEYIKDVGCHYLFWKIPMDFIIDNKPIEY